MNRGFKAVAKTAGHCLACHTASASHQAHLYTGNCLKPPARQMSGPQEPAPPADQDQSAAKPPGSFESVLEQSETAGQGGQPNERQIVQPSHEVDSMLAPTHDDPDAGLQHRPDVSEESVSLKDIFKILQDLRQEARGEHRDFTDRLGVLEHNLTHVQVNKLTSQGQ